MQLVGKWQDIKILKSLSSEGKAPPFLLEQKGKFYDVIVGFWSYNFVNQLVVKRVV